MERKIYIERRDRDTNAELAKSRGRLKLVLHFGHTCKVMRDPRFLRFFSSKLKDSKHSFEHRTPHKPLFTDLLDSCSEEGSEKYIS